MEGQRFQRSMSCSQRQTFRTGGRILYAHLQQTCRWPDGTSASHPELPAPPVPSSSSAAHAGSWHDLAPCEHTHIHFERKWEKKKLNQSAGLLPTNYMHRWHRWIRQLRLYWATARRHCVCSTVSATSVWCSHSFDPEHGLQTHACCRRHRCSIKV